MQIMLYIKLTAKKGEKQQMANKKKTELKQSGLILTKWKILI